MIQGQVTLVYLDNCCYNRPFDDQDQLRIRLETEAKLFLQSEIKQGRLSLVWSFMNTLENECNPFLEKRLQIEPWKAAADIIIAKNDRVKAIAVQLQENVSLQPADALHLACAISAKADCFFSTDRKLLKAASGLKEIRVLNPLDWIKEGLI